MEYSYLIEINSFIQKSPAVFLSDPTVGEYIPWGFWSQSMGFLTVKGTAYFQFTF